VDDGNKVCIMGQGLNEVCSMGMRLAVWERGLQYVNGVVVWE